METSREAVAGRHRLTVAGPGAPGAVQRSSQTRDVLGGEPPELVLRLDSENERKRG